MNAKTWGCVIVGVLAAHLCVIMIVDNMRTSKAPQPKPIEPNFSTSTMTVRAPDGQALKVVHEFTVETQIATPDLLKKLPAPPSQDASQPEKGVEPAPAN